MTTVTASIAGEQAYVYNCEGFHPECGDSFHLITPSQLEAMAKADDPEYYFVASHIPEVWNKEWDWEHPLDRNGNPA